MNFKKDESGYALLIVLFMIIFIMSVSVIFVRGSLSNAISEDRIDATHLTIMTSEMGVNYYQTILSNEYFFRIKEVTATAESKIKNKNKDFVKIQNEAVDQMEGFLLTKLNNEIKKERKYLNGKEVITGVDVYDGYSFYLEKSSTAQIIKSGNLVDLSLSGIVVGRTIENANHKEINKKLSFKQSFIIPSFDPSASAEDEGIDWNKIIDINNPFPANLPKSNCKSTEKIKNEDCKSDIKNKVEQIQNSTVYFPNGIKHSEELELKADKNKTTKVYIKNGLTAEELDIKSNSLLVVSGDITLEDDLDLKGNSLLVALNNLTAEEIEIKQQSFLLVKGNLNTEELDVKQQSKVCVIGNLNIKDELEIKQGGMVYVLGDSNKNQSSNFFKKMNPLEFEKKCGIGKFEVEKWLTPTIEVNYD